MFLRWYSVIYQEFEGWRRSTWGVCFDLHKYLSHRLIVFHQNLPQNVNSVEGMASGDVILMGIVIGTANFWNLEC